MAALGTGEPPKTFYGYISKSPENGPANLTWSSYEPKPFTPTDVDISITHCGVCGTDIHTLKNQWKATRYPVCVGHEIIGHAVRVGSAVTHIKVGDRVGVGAQSGACGRTDSCEDCAIGRENHCSRFVATYNSRFGDGCKSYGGWADCARIPSRFVFLIPEGLESAHAAPMMCAGITVYAPLRNNGAGKGKSVGIIGFGGLGHFGVLFAKALGCDKVVVISRTNAKKKDALAMGANGYIATQEEGWDRANSRTLDLIVSTVSGSDMPFMGYLRLLKTYGTFIQVGAPEDPIPSFSISSMITKGIKIGGACIGTPDEINEMLHLAAEKGVKPWIEKRPMSECNQVVVDMDAGKARYRYVLVNEQHAKL